MKASVVVPVHNKAPFLRECLESVFAQSFTDYELIAVDDASTDGSLDVLRSFHDPRMRIMGLDRNVGPGGAAQRGMDAARGEYILRVDADDIMLPGRFAKQVALLDGDRSIGACSGHVRLLGDPSVVRRLDLEDRDCKARMLFGVPLHQPATAYRRSVLVDHGIRFKDEWPRYGEDWMQQVELAQVTRFRNLDEPLILYRHGSNNIAFGRDHAADLRFLFRHVFDRLGFPLSEEELELQLYTARCLPSRIDAMDVRRYKDWLVRLGQLNRERGSFEEQAFQRQLDRVWDQLFFHLPRHGWSVAITHMRLGGSWSFRNLYYLLAFLMKGGGNEVKDE